jgi:hypothetical protein
MTWTYVLSEIDTVPLFQVRTLIGDTLTADQQITDEEIGYFLTQRASVYGASAMACRALAAKYSRSVTMGAGATRINFSDLSKAYAARAIAFDQQAATGVVPYAGGISIADKRQQLQDPDRVAPQFNLGQDDNYIPVAPSGNEVGTEEGIV